MTLRQRIAHFIAGKQGAGDPHFKQDALPAPFQIPAIVSSLSVPFGYSDRDAVSLASQSAILTSCMVQWLTHYPSAPMVIKDADDNVVYDHPALDPFRKNVTGLSEHELKTLSIMYAIITGTAYQVMIRNGSGVPIGVDVLHGWMCKPVSTKTERVAHYAVTGSKDTINPADVIRLTWAMRDPSNPLLGLSPLRSSFLDHASYQQVAQFTLEFLSNSATPSSILTDPNYWDKTPEQRKLLADALQDGFGNGSRGRIAYLPDDLKWQSYSHGLKDMNIEQLRMIPEANVCATFMVPPEMIGVSVGLKASTFNNKAEARRSFVQSTVSALWSQHAQVIGAMIAPDGATVTFDSSSLPAMQDDANAVTDRATKLYQSGLITLNEARAMVAYDKTEDGDAFTSTATPIADNDSVKGMRPLRTKAGDVQQGSDTRKQLWLAKNALLNGHVDSLREKLETAVSTLDNDIRNQTPGKSIARKADLPALSDESLQRLFIEGTKETRERLVNAVANQSADDVGTALTEIQDQLDSLLQDGYDISTEKVWESVETLRSELMNALATGDDITKVIGQVMTRMALTARQTVTVTNGQVQKDVWNAMNERDNTRVILKEWLSERDSKVRDSHVIADGQIKSLDEPFDVGADKQQTPGTGTIMDEFMGCRCMQIPVIRKVQQ